MKRIRFSLLCLSVAFLALPDELSAEEAADAFDCAACHPMQIRDFKGRRANPVTPVEEFPDLPSGKQDVASSPAMCFSCHDGFVMDSRDIWAGGFKGHRVGMGLPGHMALPEQTGSPEFPLNDDGNVYCGTCHSGHLNEAEGAPTKVKPFMRVSANGGNVCQACHQDKAAIAGSNHDRGSRRSKDFEHRGRCGSCHAPHGSDRPLMWARGQGEGNITVNTLCRDCHDDGPDPAEHPAHVVAWSQELRESIRGNSAAEMPVFDENGYQARVGNIGCPTCHNPHRERAAGRPEHLPGLHLRMPELVEPLCADCHGPESLFLYKFFHSTASR